MHSFFPLSRFDPSFRIKQYDVKERSRTFHVVNFFSRGAYHTQDGAAVSFGGGGDKGKFNLSQWLLLLEASRLLAVLTDEWEEQEKA